MIEDTRNPIYTETGIDQLILTPEARATLITKKKPRMLKIPVYAKDQQGSKVPLLDHEGNIIVDENGAQKYLIKDYDIIQDGWVSREEVVPASEIFTIDQATSSVSAEAVRLLTFLMWNYNHILSLHEATDDDYSILLHKIRNDAVAILQAAKSYKGGTISAIKSFRSISDSKQWMEAEEAAMAQQQPKKGGMFGGFNPLALFTGGNKRSSSKSQDTGRPVAFS